jgi:hypothetical protein
VTTSNLDSNSSVRSSKTAAFRSSITIPRSLAEYYKLAQEAKQKAPETTDSESQSVGDEGADKNGQEA